MTRHCQPSVQPVPLIAPSSSHFQLVRSTTGMAGWFTRDWIFQCGGSGAQHRTRAARPVENGKVSRSSRGQVALDRLEGNGL